MKKSEPHWFKLTGSHDAECLIGRLNAVEHTNVVAEYYNKKSGSVSGDGMAYVVSCGVKEWKNFIDETGKPIQLSFESICDLTPETLTILFAQVMDKTNESMAKN